MKSKTKFIKIQTSEYSWKPMLKIRGFLMTKDTIKPTDKLKENVKRKQILAKLRMLSAGAARGPARLYLRRSSYLCMLSSSTKLVNKSPR
jgi:hypothetical protein